ncbi:Alpha/Beta hydrolase protein [Cubamyces lactineus]|nr:Alpha/Beta hydrolase protein [Cubamyces lactineus]
MASGAATNLEWPGMPQGVESRTLRVRDLDMHLFEAGTKADPLIVLLHGFPEIAYSWRKVILPLAQRRYHVVAPDQRCLGRTKPADATAPGTARPVAFEDDPTPFKTTNMVHDVVALVFALGYNTAECVIGHDAGATVAGYCALIRPDIFKGVIFLSTPFGGPPALLFDVADASAPTPPPAIFPATLVEGALAGVNPPRKHYMLYYSTPQANEDVWHAPQGLHAFFRGYFHIKSADWAGNDPHPIEANAEGLATMPHYYIMPRDANMAQVAQADAPSQKEVEEKSSRWLPDNELAVYVREYERTGFQGGLNRYRAYTDPALVEELRLFSGMKIPQPSMYVSGRKDWGAYQNPRALDKMRDEVCTEMDNGSVLLLPGAGHWVQQEQPENLVQSLMGLLKQLPHGISWSGSTMRN